jgi:hypothetical protein
MKTTFLKITAALALACLLLSSSPAMLKNTGLNWIIPSSLSLRNNFYFGKRQWLADARTVMAAVRYLYQTSSMVDADSINGVGGPLVPPEGFDDSTNLLGLEGDGTAIPPHTRRLSRADSLILRTHLLCSYNLTESNTGPSNGVTRVRTPLLRTISPPARPEATVPVPFFCPLRSTDLEGA